MDFGNLDFEIILETSKSISRILKIFREFRENIDSEIRKNIFFNFDRYSEKSIKIDFGRFSNSSARKRWRKFSDRNDFKYVNPLDRQLSNAHNGSSYNASLPCQIGKVLRTLLAKLQILVTFVLLITKNDENTRSNIFEKKLKLFFGNIFNRKKIISDEYRY